MLKQRSPARENPPPDQVVVVMDQPPAGNASKPAKSPDPQAPSTPTTKQPSSPRPVLTRLPYSKPKSRFVELNYSKPTVQPEPTSSSSDDEDEVEDAGLDNVPEKYLLRRKKKIVWRALIEWTALVLIMAFLVSSFTLPILKLRTVWGLDLWKWSVMALVVFSGRLVSGWLVWVLVFFIERHFLLREKVLYFVYGLRRSVQNCFWLGLVLLSWTLLFDPKVETAARNRQLLARVSSVLITVLVGATIWLVKILLIKILASSFHVATFFDRMKESVFHHYILETLSGPPMDLESDDGDEAMVKPRLMQSKTMPAQLGSRRIDMERLRRLRRAGKTACSVKQLMGSVMSRGLSTVSKTVAEFGRAGSEEITSEWEARISAERVFKNVAKPGQKYIEEEDLSRFLTKEEVHTIFPLYEGALETGRIKKSAFRNWVM